LDASQVGAEPGIGYFDQIPVELRLVFAFFISPNKHDGLLERIECKGETP
jgi:hypothetical protein